MNLSEANDSTGVASGRVNSLSGFFEVRVSNFLNLYLEAVIIFGGLLGNAIVIGVFSKKTYRKNATYTYIRILAVIDFVTLAVPLTTHWINCNFRQSGKNIRMCKSGLFMARIVLDCSAWIVVAVNGNHFIAVVYPFKYTYVTSFLVVR
ncbi:hypothetical protein LSAT2_009355, partial [Lamellibrachia satsuma]